TPPADGDRAGADLFDPSGMLRHHCRRARVVGAKFGHVARRDVDGRVAIRLVPMLVRHRLVPGVVFEDEMPRILGKAIREIRRPWQLIWRRPITVRTLSGDWHNAGSRSAHGSGD